MQINHKEYQKKIEGYSNDQLHFVIQDCKEALAAMPDSEKSGFYHDEINYCAMELNKRRHEKMNFVPDSIFVESLQVGDLAPNCFGKWSKVVEIYARGIHFVCTEIEHGKNSTISQSFKVGEKHFTIANNQ